MANIQTAIQVNPDHLKRATAITSVCKEFRTQLEQSGDDFSQMFLTASAMQQIRDLFSDEMLREVRKLENTKLGYLTDRDPSRKDRDGNFPKPYADNVVRDALIEAALRGFRWFGNEINILAGNFYATKDGLLRKIRQWNGISKYRENVEPFQANAERCQVTASAEWLLNGQPTKTKGVFMIRVNRGMGDDAIKGKAESKLRRQVLFILGEPQESIDDPDAVDVETQEVFESEEQEVSIDTHTQMLQEFTRRLNEDGITYYTVRNILKKKSDITLPGQLADIPESSLNWMLEKWGWIRNEAKAAKGGEG